MKHRWLQSVDASPGLNTPLLDSMKQKLEEDPENYTNVCLTLDAMSIKKAIQFNKKTGKMVGFADFGDGVDESTVATEALVFMITGLRGQWKTPIGYFITKTLTPDTQKTLVENALIALHERGFIVQCITMDGHATNVAMCHLFGCHLKLARSEEISSFNTSFPHPATGFEIFVIFDACHMLKLVRNMFEAYRVLTNPDGKIKWEDITNLHLEQVKAGLHAANKLSDKHVNFHNQKMKVSLAAQTLSLSVASALQFMSNSGCDKFQDCHGTVRFIQVGDYTPNNYKT